MSNPTISAHDPIPSVGQRCSVSLRTDIPAAGEVGAVAVPVVGGGDPPPELGVDALALTSAGFTGARGQTLVLPHPDGVVRVAVGLGTAGTVDATLVRDVAAEFARAVPHHKVLSVEIPPADAGISVAEFAQAVTEGVILARWRFRVGADKDERALDGLVLVAPEADLEEAREGARRGQAIADAYNLGRDLANCPAATLTAARMAEVAAQLGPDAGLEVESFDEEQLHRDELRRHPRGQHGQCRAAPADPDAVCAAVADRPARADRQGDHVRLGRHQPQAERRVPRADEERHDRRGGDPRDDVRPPSGRLHDGGHRVPLCTDNMPSGTAMKLGDVLTMRNGKTVEVLNTDAEGRLVMADGLSLAVEEPVDAVVDIATLTGACLRTFGVEIAGLHRQQPALIEQLKACAEDRGRAGLGASALPAVPPAAQLRPSPT